MSFREKSAWISALSVLGIYGFYFCWVVRTAPHPSGFQFGGALIATVIALVIVQIALNVVAAILKPADAQAPRDERDRLIELRAMKVAYSGLATSVAMACLFGALDPPIVFNTNALLFILVTAELLRCVCQIIQYRRGAFC